MSQLMLHCGANAATYEDVLAVATPEATDTHFPIAHDVMIDTTLAVLRHGEKSEFGEDGDGKNVFGAIADIIGGIFTPSE